MDHKNQYWIRRSCLKAWCDPEKRDKVVHRYAQDGSYIDWRPYSRVFSADDLYTVDADGTRNVRTEKAFIIIEDAFLKARRVIESGGRGQHHRKKSWRGSLPLPEIDPPLRAITDNHSMTPANFATSLVGHTIVRQK
ncbi:hypothetical protein [Rhizobium sp. BK491]|uniref:hypothetical protein n=1 Tax=Rhizobium sp. BK491 TaxID=2587009 RepID=UPI0016144DFC|nr:hypothetical protein [Rhizobium sp. BK491]MBB3571833.1 hypothetical protein [Rhizobium sp. BK491]